MVGEQQLPHHLTLGQFTPKFINFIIILFSQTKKHLAHVSKNEDGRRTYGHQAVHVSQSVPWRGRKDKGSSLDRTRTIASLNVAHVTHLLTWRGPQWYEIWSAGLDGTCTSTCIMIQLFFTKWSRKWHVTICLRRNPQSQVIPFLPGPIKY